MDDFCYRTTFIEEKIITEVESKSQILATREDLLKTESRLEQAISRPDVKISDPKNNTIKWMVGLWLALAAMIIGIYFK